jgi:hypothetical protein
VYVKKHAITLPLWQVSDDAAGVIVGERASVAAGAKEL